VKKLKFSDTGKLVSQKPRNRPFQRASRGEVFGQGAFLGGLTFFDHWRSDPYCRSLGNGLWEVRSDLTAGKIGRVMFCIARERMVLLHGFIKKTQKTPPQDLKLALKRMKEMC
jgi:hypothetical protein